MQVTIKKTLDAAITITNIAENVWKCPQIYRFCVKLKKLLSVLSVFTILFIQTLYHLKSWRLAKLVCFFKELLFVLINICGFKIMGLKKILRNVRTYVHEVGMNKFVNTLFCFVWPYPKQANKDNKKDRQLKQNNKLKENMNFIPYLVSYFWNQNKMCNSFFCMYYSHKVSECPRSP